MAIEYSAQIRSAKYDVSDFLAHEGILFVKHSAKGFEFYEGGLLKIWVRSWLKGDMNGSFNRLEPTYLRRQAVG